GNHLNHEFIHTLQYRRDLAYVPTLGKTFPALGRKIPPLFLDDTSWSVNWISQVTLAEILNQDRDFEILMEKEAYYLTKFDH
ncbi:hypothetical protein HYY75_04845, partial [bacterium]|nr:hypothetical protein [bacterium]